jgi:hypothetical protein
MSEMIEHVADDASEILAVSDDLSRRELYGAAQMICRLARERDEARAMREPTSEMIERVANAISTAEAKWIWDHIPTSVAARAAIAAMREPTQEMIDAGDAFLDIKEAWQAMIDECLK